VADTLFTKIIKGEVPCHKVYEDEKTFAFLDLYPVNEGHVLVIPKIEIEFVWDLPDDIYQALTATTKKLALHMRNSLGVKYIHERIVGTDVPHAHIHLIPFNDKSELSDGGEVKAEDSELAAIAEKIRLD